MPLSVENAADPGTGQGGKHERDWKPDRAQIADADYGWDGRQCFRLNFRFELQFSGDLERTPSERYRRLAHQIWRFQNFFSALSGHFLARSAFFHLPQQTANWRSAMTTQTFAAVYLPKFQIRAWLSGWLAKYEAWRMQCLTIRQLRSLDAHLLEDANVDAEALFGSHPPLVRRRPAPEPTFRFDFSQMPSELPANGANCTGLAPSFTTIRKDDEP